MLPRRFSPVTKQEIQLRVVTTCLACKWQDQDLSSSLSDYQPMKVQMSVPWVTSLVEDQNGHTGGRVLGVCLATETLMTWWAWDLSQLIFPLPTINSYVLKLEGLLVLQFAVVYRIYKEIDQKSSRKRGTVESLSELHFRIRTQKRQDLLYLLQETTVDSLYSIGLESSPSTRAQWIVFQSQKFNPDWSGSSFTAPSSPQHRNYHHWSLSWRLSSHFI